MAFETFRGFFGNPQPGTGVDLAQLHLDAMPFLVDFVNAVGGGMFRDGMLSVASQREAGVDLGVWAQLTNTDARHFATTGLGDLFLVSPRQDIFWIETQYGRCHQIEVTADQFFERLAEPAQRKRLLSEELWDKRFAELKPDEVLAFAPALAFGGPLDWGNLEKVKLNEHLNLLAQIVFD